jgi:enoyl-CoA hydratase
MLVSYQLDDGVASIAMDDGKVNVLSLPMQAELNAALDQAAADGAVVVLTGRDGRFSAGFDLATLNAGGPDGLAMLRGGFELAVRLLSFATPVVIACNGHTIAMASFLLLSGDLRIGAAGPFKITANEVAIGLTLPTAAVELCRARLTPAAFNRATTLSEVFSPEEAVTAGFLDRVVPATDLTDAAHTAAVGLATLNMDAHARTKQRVRAQALAAVQAAIDAEFPR